MTEPRYILGVSCYYHDAAACLLRDGQVLAAVQEERFSRIKHDPSLPTRAIEYCLASAGIDATQLEAVVFYEKPFLKFDRLLNSYLQTAPKGLRSFATAMPVWLRQKLWIKDWLGRQLGPGVRVRFTRHHQAHAASAFYPSPFDDAAILTVDGAGEWATASCAVGHGSHIESLSELQFPHSLGLLYSAFTYFCGFRVNSGEYKLMGLAPYGEPKYAKVIRTELIDLRDDGSLRLNQDYFDYVAGLRMTNRRLDRLFGGPPRHPESAITQREMDLARSIQVVTEEAILKMARHLHSTSGQRRLCLAGGVALNCVANGRLLREGPFDRVWVQPAAGDAGGALGAALAAHYDGPNSQPRRSRDSDDMEGALLGPNFGSSECADALDTAGLQHERLLDEELLEQVADLIAEGAVVGWFQGRMEFGPRALGNRSILADPRDPAMQRHINQRIKKREDFRPFAPAVLEEEVAAWFELDHPSPYMLFTAPVAENRRCPTDVEGSGLSRLETVRSEIPAVTHVDYSSRVQTVDPARNPRFHALLKTFHRRHGCPVLLNTSFNERGEPIVCTPQDAIRCFRRCDLDALVLEDRLILRTEQSSDAMREPVKSRSNAATLPDRRGLRLAGMAWTVSLVILTIILWQWRGWFHPLLPALAGAVLAAALVQPSWLRPVKRQVDFVTRPIGWLITRSALALVFYGVVTPIGVLGRTFGKVFVPMRPDSNLASYWTNTKPDSPRSDFTKQF